MEATTCATCPKPGKLRCAGCKTTHYCSKECQKVDWKSHKKSCPSSQKSNWYIVRAEPSSTDHVLENISDQVEPFNLQHYGNEVAEIRELKARLGWKTATEVGKFYDHTGADHFYYFMYGQHKPQNGHKPPARTCRNDLASLACDKNIFGDIAVLRSGPADATYLESFTRMELIKALEYYKTENPRTVFSKREKSRYAGKLGLKVEDMPPHLYANHTAGE